MADELTIMGPGDVQPYEQQGTSIETSRATAESQAGFIMAKQFPRNQDLALNRILNSCRRVGLARQAEYAFPKGGKTVMGPSVRLAEAVAQHWGNILFGIREMEQKVGETVMMAYCYDLESNTRAERIFTVKHTIGTKMGPKELTDPRDIYEINFNLGARRKRACILEVIPGDVVELAVEACRATLEAEGEDASPENIERMLKSFEELGVTKEMIEMRQGKNIEALVPSEVAMLRGIHKSLEDGMSTPDKWFGEELLTQPKKKEPAKKKAAPKKKAPAKKKTEPKVADPTRGEASQKTAAGTGPAEPPPDDAPPPPEPNAFEEAKGSKPAPGPEAVEPSDTTITDRIQVVKFIKDGTSPNGNPWSLYHVETFNGTKLACFDKNIVATAEAATDAGQLCELEFRKTPKGLNLIGVTVLG